MAGAIREYEALGIDTFILSSYPHLEEAYRVAEHLFPLLGKDSSLFRPRPYAFERESRLAAAGD